LSLIPLSQPCTPLQVEKNLNLLAGVSHCFWKTCTHDLTIDTQANGPDDLVPIADYMSLMAKSSRGTLGSSYRY
jgi:hypothetical protein